MRLNLGSADRHIDGYVSVDMSFPATHVVEFQQADLRRVWPWSTSSIESIIAYDIVEHLPDRIHTMNELWRVLQPGGLVDIETPDASRGPGFFQDPTHVSPWVMNSFQYYQAGSYAVKRLADSYGIQARFEIVSLNKIVCPDVVEETWKIKAILKAVK